MKSLLWFGLALVAIVLIAWIVSKVTGSHTWPLDDWKFEEGETVAWRDDAADVATIPKTNQGAIVKPPRLHRWKVIATNKRVLLADKAVGGDYLVLYALYPGSAPGEDSKKADGGLLTTGYQTIVIKPGVIDLHLDDGYLALVPKPDEPSSTNMAEIRIYTDLPKTFRLP